MSFVLTAIYKSILDDELTWDIEFSLYASLAESLAIRWP